MKKILTLMLLVLTTVTFAQKRTFTSLVKLNSNNETVSETAVNLSLEYDSKLDMVTYINKDVVIIYDVTKITERKTVSGYRFTEYELHSMNLPSEEKIIYQIFEDTKYGVRLYIYVCSYCAEFNGYQLFEY